MKSAGRHVEARDMPTHPEEMNGTFDLQVGKSIHISASGRITPAGIVTAGLTTLLVALAFVAVSRRLN